jgi:chemotaxis protein methyltransferase CheR
METAAIGNIKQQIEARTGLRVRDQDLEKLREIVVSRIKHHHLASPADYQRLLGNCAPSSDPEWQKLASLITIGESYFFRDKGQFAVLREQVLPELIAAREPQRTLKIWSAGCASGEEPYSLAILVDELFPQAANWQVRIFGTDIDGDAIDRARQGIYRGPSGCAGMNCSGIISPGGKMLGKSRRGYAARWNSIPATCWTSQPASSPIFKMST